MQSFLLDYLGPVRQRLGDERFWEFGLDNFKKPSPEALTTNLVWLGCLPGVFALPFLATASASLRAKSAWGLGGRGSGLQGLGRRPCQAPCTSVVGFKISFSKASDISDPAALLH